jgi:hypothetical protein
MAVSLSTHKDRVNLNSFSGLVFCAALITSAFFSNHSLAATNLFSVSPERCVTLRAGQPCFARLYFQWKVVEAEKVCIQGSNDEPIKCWSSRSEGNVTLPLNLLGTTNFLLINEEGTVLGEAQVTVSWVYQKKSVRRRWRLF